MLYDILFLSANTFFLILPLLLLFLTKYSLYIEKFNTHPIEDDKLYNSNNLKFHFLYKVFCYSGIIISLITIILILVLNSNNLKMNKLLHLDFNFFLLVTTQVFFATTYIFLIILSLLYYRFKPDYRHRFIQRLAIYFSLISIAGSIIVLFLYFSTIKDIIAPSLIDNLVQQTASSETHLNSVFFILSLSLVIAYSFVYKKFSRRRSKINSKLYIFFYLLLITVLIIITSRTGDQYFGFNDPDALKIKIFTFEYGFSGILWQYLFMISVYSIIFSIFIYYKKDKFIGSQFAVSYTLKLAGLNYFSTVILFFVSSLPIILSNYFKFF